MNTVNENVALISHETASQVLEALNEVKAGKFLEQLIIILENRIADGPRPNAKDDIPDTALGALTYWFDSIFEVEAKRVPLPVEQVIKLAERAHEGLIEDAVEALADEEESEPETMAEMYREDAGAYAEFITLLKKGDLHSAVTSWSRQDTASRGRLWSESPSEDLQLRIFINQYG